MKFDKWNYRVEATIEISDLEIDTIIRLGRKNANPDCVEAVGFLQEWKKQAQFGKIRKSVKCLELSYITEILENGHDSLSTRLHSEFQDALTKCMEEECRINEPISDPIVVLNTSKGTIRVRIHSSGAPKTAENFLDLVGRKFYDDLTFHRYEPDFCIQGGCPKGTGTGGFVDPVTRRERTIPLEVSQNLKHDTAGVLAMARSNDPNSASSQFYFTLAPANFLNMNYAVFGKVTDGLDVVMSLRAGDRMTQVYTLL